MWLGDRNGQSAISIPPDRNPEHTELLPGGKPIDVRLTLDVVDSIG